MKLFLFLILLTGIGIVIYSQRLPYYKDNTIKNQIDIGNRVNRSLPQNVSKEVWRKEFYRIKNGTETNRKRLTDLGVGLIISSLTILIFFLKHKVSSISDLRKIESLEKKKIILYSNVAWILLIPGTILYYTYRLGRDDFSYWADSIGIPIYQDIFIGFILFFLLNLFIFLTSIKSEFPTMIFSATKHYNRAKIFWEIFFAVVLSVNLKFSYDYIIDGDHIFIPVNLFFTYILLTLRAGQINKERQQATVHWRNGG